MKQRPPVPKFIEECKTPEPQRSLIDEVIEYIYKNDLDSNVEKKAIQVLSTCRLQTNKYSVMGLVNYCLKSLGQIVPEMNKKTESVFKLIDVQQSLLIESICERMKLDQRVVNVCLTLKRQMMPLISKLHPQLQNAMTIKITTDLVYNKHGGLNIKYVAYHTKVSEETIKNSLRRIQPFAKEIIQNLYTFYQTNPI